MCITLVIKHTGLLKIYIRVVFDGTLHTIIFANLEEQKSTFCHLHEIFGPGALEV